MNITKIELLNFRNYDKLILDKFKKINIIVGNNGIGKTTILESMYLCSIGKSFRTSSDLSIIKENKKNYKIKIFIKEKDKITNLELSYNNKGKKSKINNNIIKKLSEFIGRYKVIIYSPDEVKLIKDSPSCRRNYLNIQISQLEKKYLKYLNDYNLLIKNKNEHLKNININNEYLDILDEKIINLGLKIYEYRKKYIDSVNKNLKKITKEYKNINIKYLSDFSKTKNEIIAKQKNMRKKEILLGMTTFGIHRDDLIFLLDDKDAKEYSSQGQQKLLILFLKLAEVEMFIKEYNYKPILLLDDLFSELDENNKNLILKELSKKIQIFITSTDVKTIEKDKKINIIDLNDREEI